jgi:hypothetical protein
MAQIIKILMIVALMSSLVGLSGCASESPSPPVNLQMSFPQGAPRLDKTAELLCVVKTHVLTADNVTVQIYLPDGIQLVNGDLSVQLGPMSKGGMRDFKVIIKPVRVGNYTVQAKLSLIPSGINPAFSPGPGLYEVYLSVAEDSAQWGEYPPWTPPPPSDNVGDRPTPPAISPYGK